MEYLVILFIVALVLGPVMWLRPAPADRRSVDLRNRARALGLQVRICELPRSRRVQARREAPVLGAAYSMSSHDRVSPGNRELWLCDPVEGWQGERGEPVPPGRREWLDTLTAPLPKGVTALEYGTGTASVYWSERGGPESVERIAAVLRQLLEGPEPRGSGGSRS